jgi:hypothetical protein
MRNPLGQNAPAFYILWWYAVGWTAVRLRRLGEPLWRIWILFAIYVISIMVLGATLLTGCMAAGAAAAFTQGFYGQPAYYYTPRVSTTCYQNGQWINCD